MFGTRKPSEGLSGAIWRLTGGFGNIFLSRKEISCRSALVEHVRYTNVVCLIAFVRGNPTFSEVTLGLSSITFFVPHLLA